MAASYLVIGGGLVGLGSALNLLELAPGARVTVLEKEAAAGRHQSTHNSGVLHCGLYYKPGSLKARLAVAGVRRMRAFCERHAIPHEICGKLVVAVTEAERPRLEELFRRGTANGVQGLRRLDRAGLRQIEPHAAGLEAIHVPEEGIVDYQRVVEVMVAEIQRLGGEIVTGANVRQLARRPGAWVATTGNGEHSADIIVNCAGLQCDRVARLAGEGNDVRIVPFRGEYYRLRADRRFLVKHLIYPVPDPRYPFLGVHFTRHIHGDVECGPNAVLALAREGYNWRTFSAGDLWEVGVFPGFWKFLSRHKTEAWHEITRSLSRNLFCRALQTLVPELREADLETGGAGVRAQAMTGTGELVQDFSLVQGDHSLHVLNAPSPGATASLSIGEYIARRVLGLPEPGF